MILGLDVDDTALLRALAMFGAGIESGAERAGLDRATDTAAELRANVPKRSGRLAGTVGAVRDPHGGAVTYGGGLPYARYIEGRTHAVAAAVRAGAARFPRDCQAVAEREAARI